MKDGLFGLSSVIAGALAAGVSIVIVMGSILLASSEGTQTSAIAAYPTLESIDTSTPPVEFTATELPADTATIAPTITPSATATLTPTLTLVSTEFRSTEPTPCEIPPGWIAYIVKSGDTLNKLSSAAGIPPQDLADANCLTESRLVPGSILYLPPVQPSATPLRCGPPSNWVIYIVQPGDTLFNIAQRVNSTVYKLKQANCLTSDHIRSGQELFVPYQPAPIASPTIPTATTQPPTATSSPVPTATPTDSNISQPTPPYPYPPP
jgi:LysM repeat protein